jgi:hypothetical protein
VHLRRALLLFAIVLGLAALATSVTRPAREEPAKGGPETPETSEASPIAEPPEPAELRLQGPRGRARALLETGQAGTLVVPVPEPGEVGVPDLGLTSAGTPLTPARFELIGDQPGSYTVYFTPAGTGEAHTLGRLTVR